ncbi:MAG TPA: ion transporter [Steroidobacter sp.]|uniref:ion transporter n=1 Tax=Steroidobacter sp. TaxID=1978227 RepID=UPI002ED847A3
MNQGFQGHGLRALVASDGFRSTILFLIALNAFAMGLEATPPAAEIYATPLSWLFLVSQVIFVAEIAARWVTTPRGEFFKDSWNRFDFVVVALSLMPAIGEFALVARIFRILRVLRIVSVSDVLCGSLLREDAGTRAILVALLLVLLSGYVFALSGFHLFGKAMIEWSSLAESVASLVRSLTPTGFVAALEAGGGLLLFHALFYVSLLSTLVNLGAALLRKSGEAAS